MRIFPLVAALLLTTLSLAVLAPGASASSCEGNANARVCYQPSYLQCFVGAYYDVGPVYGQTCVNWCRILGCPGPVLS